MPLSKISSLFHDLDEFVFKKIDLLKTSTVYQKSIAKLSELSPLQQKIVGQSFTLAIILLPLVFIFTFFIGNWQLKNELETRKEILEVINDYTNKKTQLGIVGSSVISPSNITSKADVQNLVREVLDGKKIETKKVDVNSFNTDPKQKAIQKNEADLSFKDFSISELTNFLFSLLQDKKAKISQIKIFRNAENSTLWGELHIVLYNRTSSFNENK